MNDTLDAAFERWWENEALPYLECCFLPGRIMWLDLMKLQCRTAWCNGAYKAVADKIPLEAL